MHIPQAQSPRTFAGTRVRRLSGAWLAGMATAKKLYWHAPQQANWGQTPLHLGLSTAVPRWLLGSDPKCLLLPLNKATGRLLEGGDAQFFVDFTHEHNAPIAKWLKLKGQATLTGWKDTQFPNQMQASVIALLSITSGAGSASGLRHVAWGAARDTVKRVGNGVAVVFTIALDTAEWLNDYQQIDPATGKPKKDLADLFAKIGIDFVKAGMGAGVATALGWIGLTLLGLTTGAGIVVVVGVAIVAAIVAGIGLDSLDRTYGITDTLASELRFISKPLEDKNPSDYKGYTDAMGAAYMGNN